MDRDEHPNIRRQKVFESLCDQLTWDRTGVHQGRMGQILFRAERDGRHLVGLIDESQRAVFYDPRTEELIAVPFNEHELVSKNAETVWQQGPVNQSWQEALEGEFDWLHPRHR